MWEERHTLRIRNARLTRDKESHYVYVKAQLKFWLEPKRRQCGTQNKRAHIIKREQRKEETAGKQEDRQGKKEEGMNRGKTT